MVSGAGERPLKPSMSPNLAISPLCIHPEWIADIAPWHHQEWLRARGAEKMSAEEEQQKFAQRLQALQKHLNENSLPITFVAHRELQPLGTVSLVFYRFSNGIHPSEWLTNFYVLPEWRGQGVGSRLLQAAVEFARQRNLTQICLYTHDRADFYLKRDWQRRSLGRVMGQSVDILSLTL